MRALLRRFYLRIAFWRGEAPLPAGPDPEWPRERIEVQQHWSRYYLVSNLVRGAIYIPFFIFALEAHLTWTLVTVIPLFVLHGLSIILELYKQALMAAAIKGASDEPYHEPVSLRTEQLTRQTLRLFAFENRNFYKNLGMEMIRKITFLYVWMSGAAKVSKYLEKSGREQAANFAISTISAEIVHGIGAVFNAILTYQMWRAGQWSLSWYAFLWFYMDANLVLLQRYHRVRIWSVLKRARK